ncbi:dihydroorotase [Clostridium thermosuccinogenes]|uniref:Dihydroorotase n=1 Tax=Clostridium thermosuccinogenes TaxID=84032 RepID=A0A2K2FPB5_9CLOT|nr:dihydroorotase [Pseudoclostridium thermosuccinogenes]AUS96311.1 dihydroorotase [Pseudoclostridium thermosuccinogenes]PNT98525.1 dihydroorotase [Pseudoclostridium thermosuccinogenes]PNU00627.1 dihydroorotase [Pseudoclostridium thermosuccinogenes]
MRILIKNGHVIDLATKLNGVYDVMIEDGRVVEIARDLDITNGELIDAEGKYVLPGLVDAHCHLRDPGFEYKEDIESGTRSAAKGGFTSIACMPNTNPVIDNEAMVKYIINKAKTDGVVNVFPIGSISKGQKGEELSEIGELKFAGAVAISDDGRPVASSSLMKKALQYASMFDMTVISHCEDPDLSDAGVMNEGTQSTLLGLKGIPSAAEEVMVARDLILAEYTKTPIHIAHVSTELSVDLIRHAKKRGVKVTAETCPHYFSLTEKACDGFNTLAKVNPPLRTSRDVEAVIEGLKDGTIDIIATDHAPHHMDEKEVEFDLAANGMVGFETALPLVITYLVKPGHLTLENVVEKMCVNPSRILGLNKGTIEIGKPADLIIVDTDEVNTVDVQKFASKSKNSPFDGYKLSGAVYCTIVGGKVVVREKVLLY